jgi:hypothetical protein
MEIVVSNFFEQTSRVEILKSSYRMPTWGMMYKGESFKCRLCPECFSTPDELRFHRMNKHKGYMLRHKG